MRQALKKKIRSRRGASITFALLLFLVCAVVGSAVLTAGTVAAGRMSKIAEMDQRYYSVNSAARLVIQMVDGQEVTIVEDKDGITVNGMPNSADFTGIEQEAAYYIVHTVDKNPNNNVRSNSPTSNNSYKMTVQITPPAGNDVDLSALKASIEESFDIQSVDTDGDGTDDDINATMFLDVTSNDNKYCLRLSFNMDKRETVEQRGTDTVTTSKIMWHLKNIEVVSTLGD